jgi:hypothetical protein
MSWYQWIAKRVIPLIRKITQEQLTLDVKDGVAELPDSELIPCHTRKSIQHKQHTRHQQMHTILGNRFRWLTSTRITSNRLQETETELGHKPPNIFIRSNTNSNNPRLILPPTNLRMGIPNQWDN